MKFQRKTDDSFAAVEDNCARKFNVSYACNFVCFCHVIQVAKNFTKLPLQTQLKESGPYVKSCQDHTNHMDKIVAKSCQTEVRHEVANRILDTGPLWASFWPSATKSLHKYIYCSADTIYQPMESDKRSTQRTSETNCNWHKRTPTKHENNCKGYQHRVADITQSSANDSSHRVPKAIRKWCKIMTKSGPRTRPGTRHQLPPFPGIAPGSLKTKSCHFGRLRGTLQNRGPAQKRSQKLNTGTFWSTRAAKG